MAREPLGRNENGYVIHPDRQRLTAWAWLATGLAVSITAVLTAELQTDPSYLTLLFFGVPLMIYGATGQFGLAALPIVLYVFANVTVAFLTAANPVAALLTAGVVALIIGAALLVPLLLLKAAVDR